MGLDIFVFFPRAIWPQTPTSGPASQLKVPRRDIKGKKIFEINDKYYFEDLGLRHSVIRYNQLDISKVMENLVFNHLIADGYDVNVGRLDKREVDFVGEKSGERMYIQ